MSSSRKYGLDELVKIGRKYVEGNKSIKELAEQLGLSTSTVSSAKKAYLARKDGRSEMEDEVDQLKEKVEELKSRSREGRSPDSSSTIDLEKYAVNTDEDGNENEEAEEGGWGWIWLLVGEVAALYWMWTTFFKNTGDRS